MNINDQKTLKENPAFVLCPKCYPENKSLLFVLKEKPGFVFCRVHGEMKWPIDKDK